MTLLTELATYLRTRLNKADWCTKREIIRAIVQRIEIGPTNLAIVLRLPTEISVRGVEPIVVVTYEGLASRKGSATADHWIETLCLRMLGNGDGTARFIMLD